MYFQILWLWLNYFFLRFNFSEKRVLPSLVSAGLTVYFATAAIFYFDFWFLIFYFDLWFSMWISEHYFHCLFCSGCNCNVLLWLLILNVNIRALFSRIYDVAVIMKTIWRLNFENVLHRIDHHSDSVTLICFKRQFFPLFMFFLHL